jgi:uncharacterized membrane protein YozB (DUF420 family)
MTLSVQAIKATGRSRAVPWFGASFVACCAIVIVFGFSFTFVPEVLGKIRPIWLYLHIAAAAAWLGLVVVQAVLAMQRKLALHRAIGAYGFGLGATAAVTAFITAFVLRHDSVVAHSAHDDAPGRIGRIAFLAIPLNSAIVFSTLLACAWLWRHRPPMHRRFMLLATAVLTLPAVARMPGISELGPLILAPTDLLILTLCGIDLWRERAVHRVYWIAAPGVIAMQLLATFLIVAHPAWWVRTASILLGV